MANPGRIYDKTHLSLDMAEERGIVHRDYLAHCMRWSHVMKRLYERKMYSTARILDVGCGKELPLAKMMYANKMSGAEYCGVDMNKIEPPEMLLTAVRNGKMKVWLYPEQDASLLKEDDLPWKPNVITCFECWEHMHPRIARNMITVLRDLISDDGRMFFSTPCWNGSAAANHINETTYGAMAAVLHDVGWEIIHHYGTFASQRDYQHMFLPEQAVLYDTLAEYYDSNVLACIFAPMFPNSSRNVLWECVKTDISEEQALPGYAQPWSQHPEWEALHVQSV